MNAYLLGHQEVLVMKWTGKPGNAGMPLANLLTPAIQAELC